MNWSIGLLLSENWNTWKLVLSVVGQWEQESRRSPPARATRVALWDVDPDALKRAEQDLQRGLTRLADKGKLTRSRQEKFWLKCAW